MLEPNRSAHLSPGTFRLVRVAPNATLTLAAGVYFIERLQLEPGAVIQVSGPTTVDVLEHLIHRGSYRQSDGSLAAVSVRFRGYDVVALQAPFHGDVLAPNAAVILGNGEARAFRGRFFARSIEVLPDTTVTLSAAGGDAMFTTMSRSGGWSQPQAFAGESGGPQGASCQIGASSRSSGILAVLGAFGLVLLTRRRVVRHAE